MMAAKFRNNGLLDRLPPVRGTLEADAPLAKFTWFRVGGPAEVLFRPADEDDLAAFLALKPVDAALTILGLGSNLIVRDGGVPGVVVRLGREFAEVTVEENDVVAGAAAADITVARRARDAGIAGLEFLSGIPGAIGGAVAMNGGAYGKEMKDVTVSVRAVAQDGEILDLDLGALAFGYRTSAVPAGAIVTRVRLRGAPGTKAEIAARMEEIQRKREHSQPVRLSTGGSTFKNPDGAKAWQLIEGAGCRGLVRGGAQVSEQHCNFLINTGNATAADLEGLGEEVRRRVFEKSGVTLEWEIRRIGVAPGPVAAPLDGPDGKGGTQS